VPPPIVLGVRGVQHSISALAHPHRKSNVEINSSMAEQQQTNPVEVAFGQLIAINADFEVLLCVARSVAKLFAPLAL
jgi:hypothetical protein